MPPFPSMMMRRRGGPTLTASSTGSANVGITGGGYATTPTVTAVPTGGLAPYTYSWTKVSGTTFDVGAASSAATTFGNYVSNGGNVSATYRCTIISSDAQLAIVDVSVYAGSTFAALSAGLTHGSISASEPYDGSPHQAIYTSPVYCNASGGSGSYSYEWIMVSGPSPCAVSPNWNYTQFIAGFGGSGPSYSWVYFCRVSDGVSSVDSGTVSVTISCT